MNCRMAAVLIVAAAHFFNQLPVLLNFDRFAFGDNGWPLVTDSMVFEDRQVPTKDFAYFYGLLTLLIDHIWFALFGRTPEAVVGLYAVCSLAIAVGAARVMAALNLKLWPSLFLIACTSSVVIPRGFPSPAHALEAAFLTTALAEHARGRLNWALVFAVLAVLAKASLGYVYGLLLVLLVLAKWPATTSRWQPLVEPFVIALIAVGGLILRFGIPPVKSTLLPLDGMKVYSDQGVGFFFGAGRFFWWPEPFDPVHYLGIPGPWLACTVVLFAAAIRLVRRWREPGANIALTCAVLHGVFVFFLFGNEWSWIYYSFALFIGTAVALDRVPWSFARPLTIALSVTMIVGQANWIWSVDNNHWRITERSPATGGLFAPPQEIREWEAVRAKKEVFVLTRMGCPQVLAPEVWGPRWWCLIEPIMKPREASALRKTLSGAEYIVSPNWHDNNLMTWGFLQDQLNQFEPDPECAGLEYLRVYRRKR